MAITLTLSYPSFSPNTTILSAQVNQNGTDLTTWAALFATGTGWVFTTPASNATAVNINGVTSQSVDILDVNLTASGTNTFKIDKVGQGTFTAGAASSTPLTVTSVASASAATLKVNMGTSQSQPGMLISGASSITGNIFECDLTSGGTVAFWIDKNGQVNLGEIGGSNLPNTPSIVGGGSGAIIFNAASGATNAFQWGSGAAQTSTYAILGKAGFQISPTINSTNTLGYVPPVYTNGGAATGSSMHAVIGTYSGTGSNVTISLTGAAVFSSTSSFVSYAGDITGGNATAGDQTAGNSVTFTPSVSGHTYVYFMFGT